MPKVLKTPVKNSRIHNQLVGFSTLLLIIAFIFPWIVTDKSRTRTKTTPIFTPSTLNSTNQLDSIDTVNGFNSINNSINNNLSSNGAIDIPYIDDTESNITDLGANDAKSSISDQKSYLIQLVALKNRQKIDELIALLRLNSYDVKAIPKKPAPDQLIKLVIGPYAKREQAEQVIMDLNNLTKLKGIIVAN
ncbi:SPOR domain-containing protein [Orbaceae bacterium ESL0721]|nr:SPOR domain-containing protein [Orbaceae bacterium ESL0721]